MSSHPPAFTAARLLQVLGSLPAVDAYLVGFSGGADSTALLHALCSIRDDLRVPVSAIHVNHGMHGDADQWQARCEQFCDQLGVGLASVDIAPLGDTGKGLEAEARQLRYEAIANLMMPGAALLTAHHADDQAETLLLNLMRGSGVDGLAAMPESRPFGPGLLQRPLLEFQGSALRDYLAEQGVEWVEDPSNEVLDHDRNFVRHELVPLLEGRWPGLSKRLLLTRKAMGGARQLLEDIADEYLADHLVDPLVLGIGPRAIEHPELFKLVVRRWTKGAGAPSVPHYRLDSLHEQACRPGDDHSVAIEWDSCVLRWYKQQLWLTTAGDIRPCPQESWPPGASFVELGEDAGRLTIEGAGAALSDWQLAVRNRSSIGDTRIIHGGHHRHLKNVFQAAGVPPWLRDSIPLLTLDGQPVAVGDWYLADAFAKRLAGAGCSLRWRPGSPLLEFVRSRQAAGG
ncbi:MAG: tRNA lysidine(34) synthetase TilS [Lysobacterales bacterium]|jgi:tRNA(Ile)-lysidine synthase